MAVKRCGPAVVAVDGLLYVIGGNQPQDSGWISVSSVEQFDPVTETWKESPPLLDSRSEAGVIVVWNDYDGLLSGLVFGEAVFWFSCSFPKTCNAIWQLTKFDFVI